jgi:LysR family transcriptional regulator, benzoate and cis,cis-muconate-responsive activator of ben and cat genes
MESRDPLAGGAHYAEHIRKFVAVAEELHFGRAAQRLGIAQPPLSRAIRQLERQLGVELFDRTNRRIALTAAGEVLLSEGRKALTSLAAAARRAQRAGHPDPRLVLAMKPGGDAGLLDEILPRYAEHPDAVQVDITVSGIAEYEGLLRSGQADLAMLRIPHNDPTGLATEELLTERQVVVLRRDHRLAGRASVRMADLADETHPWGGDGCPANNGHDVRDTGQVTELIALGRAIAVLPESITKRLRRDLVAVPVIDGELTTLVVAWSEESRSRPLAAFVRTASEVAHQARTEVGAQRVSS